MSGLQKITMLSRCHYFVDNTESFLVASGQLKAHCNNTEGKMKPCLEEKLARSIVMSFHSSELENFFPVVGPPVLSWRKSTKTFDVDHRPRDQDCGQAQKEEEDK